MSVIERKKKIKMWNRSYREGNPAVTDLRYDDELELLRLEISHEEYEDFIKELMEVGGDIVHDYVIGSLRKCKYGEADQPLTKFLTKFHINKLLAQVKLDGMCFVAKYSFGNYMSAATRGDGTSGEDITEACRFVLPATIDSKEELTEVRGELTLTGDSHIVLGYKNRRNGTVGIIKKEKIIPTRLAHVKAYCYQILGSRNTRVGQLLKLEELGFLIPDYDIISITPDMEEILKAHLEAVKVVVPYDIDGLVICDINYGAENVTHPEGMVAFKVDTPAVQTKVTGLRLRISKGGLLKPTVLLEPQELCGTTVAKATGYNMRYILNNRIWEGAIVRVTKGGDIIPKIVETMEPGKGGAPWSVCPSCGGDLEWNIVNKNLVPVDLKCNNDACPAQGMRQLEYFIRCCNVEGASGTSFEKWGINCIEDLLTWSPNGQGRMAEKFYDNLQAIFKMSKADLMGAMPFNGGGKNTVGKIIEFYGSCMLKQGLCKTEGEIGGPYPEGMGEKSLLKIFVAWKANLEIVDKIVDDPRYKEEKKVEAPKASDKFAGKTFCITGTLSKPRKHFEQMVVANGGELASVSKNLNYLLVGEDAGGKLAKAEKLGITILNEQAFMKMI